MTRIDQNRNLLIAALAVAAFFVTPHLALAAQDACPEQVKDHIPMSPSSPAALNIGTVKDQLLEYHQKYYDLDVAAVFASAQKYLEANAAKVPRPALVLDIDETSLTNWPNLLADNFGFIAPGSCDALPAGPCGFDNWILQSKAKAIPPALDLFKAAKKNGVAVIFITGRPTKQRDATIINLDHAGFDGWTELRTRPDRDDLLTVQEFKSAERTKVEEDPDEHYTIIANVGDQISDVTGPHLGCPFKVPNPFYFIR